MSDKNIKDDTENENESVEEVESTPDSKPDSKSDSTSSKNAKDTGRKLPQEYENPVDNMMLSVADTLSPQFKKMNYTPNGITTLSVIFSAAALYHLYNHDMIPFTIYVLLAHFCDDMDGFYARKYKMVSEGGDKYDHYKDLIVVIASIYILYSRYNILNFPVLILVLCVMGILGIMFVGCQENLTSSKNRSDTLSFANYVTPKKENCKSHIKYLRYFGAGSLIIVFILVAWYLNTEMNNSDASNIGYSGQDPLPGVDPNIVDISRPFHDFGPTPNIHELMLYQQPSSSYRFSR